VNGGVPAVVCKKNGIAAKLRNKENLKD